MNKYMCPICRAETNSSGDAFSSDWAVATHVAGKLLFSADRLHKSWAQQKAVTIRSRSVPKLAEQLTWALRQELNALSDHKSERTPLVLVQEAEVLLHRHIKRRLEGQYGSEQEAWWVQGVPAQIRKECASRREDDPRRDELYSYTYMLDLQAILDKGWGSFEADFQRLRSRITSKKEFLERLRSLNEIRNRHAHPVRAPQAGSLEFTRDAESAEEIWDIVAAFCGEAE